MRRHIIVWLFSSLLCSAVCAQEKIIPSDSFLVSGLVESPVVIHFDDLNKYKLNEIGGMEIANHKGEVKRVYKSLKGVLLTDVLSGIKIASPEPRSLNQYYLVAKGSDGYAALFSWNELFNNEGGRSFFLVTEADGEFLRNREERILLVSAKDIKKGRRFVKALVSIEVKRNQ